MTSGSALILVRPGRAGHGRLGISAADVSRGRNLNQARISSGPVSGDRTVKLVTILAKQCLSSEMLRDR